jgi:hypothetical protein
MLSARSLRKASVPPSLLSDPSPGCLQPTRLAVHVRTRTLRSTLSIARAYPRARSAHLLQNPKPPALTPESDSQVNGDGGSCSAYFASGGRVYKIEVPPFSLSLSLASPELLLVSLTGASVLFPLKLNFVE